MANLVAGSYWRLDGFSASQNSAGLHESTSDPGLKMASVKTFYSQIYAIGGDRVPLPTSITVLLVAVVAALNVKTYP